MLSIAESYGTAHALGVKERQSAREHTVSPIVGATLGERIDLACRLAGVSTTDLAKTAGVTWAAAKRWRKGTATPKANHLGVIAGVCGVTVEELLGVMDGQDPPFAAWDEFVAQVARDGVPLSSDERRALQSILWPDGTEPTVTTYQMARAMLATARRRD